MQLRAFILGAIVVLGQQVAADEIRLQRFNESRPLMGSMFTIALYAENEKQATEAFAAAFDRVEQLNGIFSDYDPQSEANRLSRMSPMTEPVAISHEMAKVLADAIRLSERSDGAFDVTVGPLSKLWRRARRRNRLPDAERLAEARRSVGYEHLRLDVEQRRLQMVAADMRLDFGGIAKGFAADEALAEVAKRGCQRALVNAGGDLAIGDPPPGEDGWLVGIAPLNPDREPSRFLRLAHCGVATSGDAWQFVEIDGRRFSHIIDPRTGLGLTHRSSVTVVAANCTAADSLASAVSALDAAGGMKLIEATAGASCLRIQVENGKVRVGTSRGFPASSAEEAADNRAPKPQ